MCKQVMSVNVCSYINYSEICAKVVRRCLKPELRTLAAAREETALKTAKWEGGKVVQQSKYFFSSSSSSL